ADESCRDRGYCLRQSDGGRQAFSDSLQILLRSTEFLGRPSGVAIGSRLPRLAHVVLRIITQTGRRVLKVRKFRFHALQHVQQLFAILRRRCVSWCRADDHIMTSNAAMNRDISYPSALSDVECRTLRFTIRHSSGPPRPLNRARMLPAHAAEN